MQIPKSKILTDIELISRISAVSHILEIVCNTTGMGFAAVARVTEDSWTACAVHDEINFGLAVGGELKLETTICNEIRQHRKPVVINHVAEDEQYINHHTPLMYGFQSYISMPINLKDGSFFGTLCAIDPKPAVINTSTIVNMFRMFADLIAFHLDALEQLDLSERTLRIERETSELREQFIAILGHDLRNPLNAVSNSAQLLSKMNVDERTVRLGNIIKDSAYRMNGLIENMLDFASGRLGGGITINRNANEDLHQNLVQVISEMQANLPERTIKTSFNFNAPVHADGKRIAQLFSNLLGNALNYSAANAVVKVTAISNEKGFSLCVSNPGKQISDATMGRLFQPFSRGEVEPNQKGLGLGLYIASEIAVAHGGKLEVSSTAEQTCFTLNLPASV
ncbi:GAF domain-containing sensor histidine kinase [Pedobacter nototheniae]|uniref:GAF domain-containing sensor histidine kinase n=1 Tax=Pedobacter nototheniae TaxID=2488994 RepID=UPI00292E3148|nr:GAF domain-containing sensor histidine kinase [Pedobacter nototheniae]